jgi:uncharacterized protein
MALENITINSTGEKLSFLGTGWAFPPLFNIVDGSTEMVSDFRDIIESLHILFSVSPGERVTQLRYGCDLFNMLFEPISSSLEYLVKDLVTAAIDEFEPRIDVLEVNTDTINYMEGVVRIEITYRVRATNTRHNIVFPFYKNEGTSLPEASR